MHRILFGQYEGKIKLGDHYLGLTVMLKGISVVECKIMGLIYLVQNVALWVL
jgi:hypothetical protein